MNKKLEKRLNSDYYRGRKQWYHIKKCFDCGKEYIGGTNSQRCKDCADQCLVECKRKRQKNKKLSDKCIFCGIKERLEIHHIDANPKNNDPKNLLVICINCHRKLHGKIYNKIFNPRIRKLIRLIELWQKEQKQKKKEIKS